MAEHRYDPQEIEPRWQAVWAEEKTWEVTNDPAPGKSSYILVMLPYPSGEPHIGHLKVYTVGDAIAHFHRRRGERVLNPMGYDAFGLPAENHAIATGVHPRDSTAASIAAFRRQFRRWGVSIDWSRELATNDPAYYRWTQWIFLELLRAGLAYKKKAAVNWCPVDATVLANEQVINGRCERCGSEVETRQLEQWLFRTTAYAERLLDDLELIDWPEHVKTMQRNWIGRSEGALVSFRSEDADAEYPVFTTRPDTLFGATFFVMAPEHPDVLRLAAGGPHEEEVRAYVDAAHAAPNSERSAAERPKTGVPLGRNVINPVNGEAIPIWVADYVLIEYGTGAIMAVPGHDERDHAFAEVYGLPIRRVIEGGELPYPGDGRLVNSHPDFDGLHNREALRRIVAWLAQDGRGEASVNYRLRDWLVSRQRYWGCPIPVVYCERCGLVPVPADQLPVVLPDIEDYAPHGRSPLAAAEDWVATTCPTCGGPARRETDTMDTFVDSSWYFLRYCDPHNDKAAWDAGGGPAVDAGRPVHRRDRARDPPPDVRPLLHQGARRPRPRRLPGAVLGPLHAGDDHARRGEDVEVQGQRRLAGPAGRPLRGRHRPRVHPLHRAARPGRRLERRGPGGSPSISGPVVEVVGRDGRRAGGRGFGQRRRRAAGGGRSRADRARPTGRSTR